MTTQSVARRLTIYADGASRGNPGKAAIGAVLEDPAGYTVAKISRCIGTATNNVAEYRALLAALQEALRLEVTEVLIYTDSELMARQLTGRYRVKSERLKPLYRQVKDLLGRFASYQVRHIRRSGNSRADTLANQALEGSDG